ncbi:non-homologous end-joining DNA ligase [Desulfotomaculum sp. 1211_IL3151]|uniref:non-homologous end-joining DNA ligase n=1 Tax=Desulfotomaculum sp. 1211_IL3151 TaxID=3084055 RepID=UPI002FD98003
MRKVLPKIKPMLAIPAEPFNSDDFLYEIKWDGYRGLAYLEQETTILSRNLMDLTARFPELQQLHQKVSNKPVILDGEIVVLDEGKPSFSKLQSRGKIADSLIVKRLAKVMPATFIAFDILYQDGISMMHLPLAQRKTALEETVEQGPDLIVSQYVYGSGIEFSEAVKKVGLEGIMAKRLDSLYTPGKRATTWRKIRNNKTAELVIAGWEKGDGYRRLGSLVLVCFHQGEWVYVGKVGTGFTRDEEAHLLTELNQIKTYAAVFTPSKGEFRAPLWVKPQLVCEVTYTEVSPDGRLRHPSYQGLREDKKPEECTIKQLAVSHEPKT